MFQQKKPYSAVTVTIENLTSEAYEEDDFSGVPELVEVIKLQASGPAEAARAIRKKLKYGNVHRQVRALVLLDGLIQNAGPRFQRAFVDEPLLERLRVCGTSDLSDPEVKKKCTELFRNWSAYGKTPGLERISRLHKELPKRKVVVTQAQSKVLKETEENPFGDDEEEEATRAAQEREKQPPHSGPSNPPVFQFGRAPDMAETWARSDAARIAAKESKKKDKSKNKSKNKSRKQFNLEAEKEQMKTVIAESSIASINLLNALQSINRERERISENQNAAQQFETCKQLRRRVLRYIHHVEHEQWLGGLLHANDELVHALMTFEQLDQSIDADSDSDDELAEQAHMYRMATTRGHGDTSLSTSAGKVPELAGLHIDNASLSNPPPQPARPHPPAHAQLESDSEGDLSDDNADENDPFADRNVVYTPQLEKGEPRW